jgi:hypothetical protein
MSFPVMTCRCNVEWIRRVFLFTSQMIPDDPLCNSAFEAGDYKQVPKPLFCRPINPKGIFLKTEIPSFWRELPLIME